jgi:hypothetical protein
VPNAKKSEGKGVRFLGIRERRMNKLPEPVMFPTKSYLTRTKHVLADLWDRYLNVKSGGRWGEEKTQAMVVMR